MDASNVSVTEFVKVVEYHRDPTAKRMPDCVFASSGCKNKARWIVSGGYMCTGHRDETIATYQKMLDDITARPEGADDEDMDLLELLWDEIQHEKRPNVLVEKVVKELGLEDGAAGRNLASWYLWYMGILNIHQRADTYEL